MTTINWDTPHDFIKIADSSVLKGEIVEVDYENDTATVDIDGIGEIEDIEIFYHCPEEATTEGGSKAFNEGDKVFILNTKVGGGVAPGADYLKIIAFQDGLKPCGKNLLFMWDPIFCFDHEGNPVICDHEDSSRRMYSQYHVKDWSLDPEYWDSLTCAMNGLCNTGRNSSSHGAFNCFNSYSKTYDDYTAIAVEVEEAMSPPRWYLSVDHLGKRLTVDGQSMFPPDGLSNRITHTDHMGNQSAVYKAFDIWKEGNDTFVSCIGDVEQTMYVAKVSDPDSEIEVLHVDVRAYFATRHPPNIIPEHHCHLLGCTKKKAYWAYTNVFYGTLQGIGEFYEVDMSTESITLTEEAAVFAAIDEKTGELDFYPWTEVTDPSITECIGVEQQSINCWRLVGALVACGDACPGSFFVVDSYDSGVCGELSVMGSSACGHSVSCEDEVQVWTSYILSYTQGGSKTLQTFGGSKLTDGNEWQSRKTFRWWCSGTWITVSGYPIDQGIHTYYNNFIVGRGVSKAHIAPDKVGFQVHVNLWNGKDLDITETEEDWDEWGYEDSYKVNGFPFQLPYALLKHGKDVDGNEHIDVTATRRTADGKVVVGSLNLPAGPFFFETLIKE